MPELKKTKRNGRDFDTQARARERKLAHSIAPNLFDSFRLDHGVDDDHHWMIVPFVMLWRYFLGLWDRLGQSWWGRIALGAMILAPPLLIFVPVLAILDIVMRVLRSIYLSIPNFDEGAEQAKWFLGYMQRFWHTNTQRIKEGKGGQRGTLLATGYLLSLTRSTTSTDSGGSNRTERSGLTRSRLRRRSQRERQLIAEDY